MRGKLEQRPIIIPSQDNANGVALHDPNSDSESVTTSGSDEEGDDQYKSRLSNGHNASREALRYPKAPLRQTKASGTGPSPQASPRGRQETSMENEVSEKPPRLERERSPYSSGPANTVAREGRFPTDNLLPPTLRGPASPTSKQHRSLSQTPPVRRREGPSNGSNREKPSPTKPTRPAFDRRASAMPELGRSTPPSSPIQARGKPGHYSSDESEGEAARRRARTAQIPPEARSPLANSQGLYHAEDKTRASSRNPTSPPRTPTAADHHKPQGLNREALLKGAAASLSGLLDGPQRKASPRPSPLASPNSSPYPSPPRTPPEPHRPPALKNLKNDSPSSRPSSPLSTGRNSPINVGASRMPPVTEQETRAPRYESRPRASSPLPGPRRSENELPKIDVRSPSPLPPPHHESLSQENNEPRTPSRYMPPYALQPTTLQPIAPGRRQRSLSNAEGQSQRPNNLVIEPPKVRPSDVEYLSPTSENTPAHFRSQQTLNALLSPTSSAPRSRSTVPALDQVSARSSSAVPAPSSRPRSKSTAAAPEVPYSDQRHPDPVLFPPCLNPKPISGYRDWYALDGCEAFTICRDCRSRIFGQGYQRQFKPYAPPIASMQIICAINDPWIRMACLASILEGSNDLSPVVNLTVETEDRSPCPQKSAARRDWYYLRDPEADENLADFRVCSHCAHSIYALFPMLDRVFKRGDAIDNEMLLCSVRSADLVRFGQYVDYCEKAHQAALRAGKKHPDMSDFIWYHKKETVISDCTRDQVLIGRDWHRHPDIPQCTICEECYYETVRPHLKRGYAIAQDITPVAKHINDGVSCSLYSPRMKEVFKIACEDDDLKYFSQNVTSRWELQVKIIAAKMTIQKYPRDKEAQEELNRYMEKWHKMEKARYADKSSSYDRTLG